MCCSGCLLGKLPVKVLSKRAILINADSGAVLYEKHKDEQAYPASITKIATALYALEHGADLDQMVVCPSECLTRICPKLKVDHNYTHPPHWLEYDGTSFGILRGEVLPLRSLFYGMMLVSGNDASNVIAHHIGGNVLQFMDNLNDYLQRLGCQNTQFCNPHGLHHPQHYTTAHDMALIARAALNNPRFRKIVGALEHQRPNTNKQKSRTIIQANRLLKKSTKFYYSKAFGIKTGGHSKAGYTFVAAAKHNERTLIAVILGSPDPVQRYRDVINLFDAAFAETKTTRVLFRGKENLFHYTIEGAKNRLFAQLNEDVFYSYYPSEESVLSSSIEWNIPALPVKAGACVGFVVVTDEWGNEVARAPLVAKDCVDLQFWWPIWNNLRIRYGVLLVLLILIAIFVVHFAPQGRKLFKR